MKTLSNLKQLHGLKFLVFAWLPAYAFGGYGVLLFLQQVEHRGMALQWVLLGLLLFQGLGVHLGYHRLFAHRSFTTHRPLQLILAALGCLSLQHSPIFWATTHRLHHRKSDTENDPHSPARGFFFSFQSWYFRSHNMRPRDVVIVRDLTSDPILVWMNRYYYQFVWLTLAIIAVLFGPSTVIYLVFVPALLGFFIVGAVNTLCHLPWRLHPLIERPHDCKDRSRNIAILSLFTFGLSLHNNHHANPNKKKYSEKWYEIDPLTWIILLIEKR